MFFRTVIAFDRVKQRMEIVSIVLTEEAHGSHQQLRDYTDAAVVVRSRWKTNLRGCHSWHSQTRQQKQGKSMTLAYIRTGRGVTF
jgi:hypothetical protein